MMDDVPTVKLACKDDYLSRNGLRRPFDEQERQRLLTRTFREVLHLRLAPPEPSTLRVLRDLP